MESFDLQGKLKNWINNMDSTGAGGQISQCCFFKLIYGHVLRIIHFGHERNVHIFFNGKCNV